MENRTLVIERKTTKVDGTATITHIQPDSPNTETQITVPAYYRYCDGHFKMIVSDHLMFTACILDCFPATGKSINPYISRDEVPCTKEEFIAARLKALEMEAAEYASVFPDLEMSLHVACPSAKAPEVSNLQSA